MTVYIYNLARSCHNFIMVRGQIGILYIYTHTQSTSFRHNRMNHILRGKLEDIALKTSGNIRSNQCKVKQSEQEPFTYLYYNDYKIAR